jgi:hypothetical protein
MIYLVIFTGAVAITYAIAWLIASVARIKDRNTAMISQGAVRQRIAELEVKNDDLH